MEFKTAIYQGICFYIIRYSPTNWETFSKSKAEFTDEIKELARKAANTTSKAELEYIHRRRTELCAEYMSDVSPDRKALYRQAENALKGQGGNPKCKGSGELTLIRMSRLSRRICGIWCRRM